MKYINKLKKLTKESLTDNIYKRLLELEFKSNNSLITKVLKHVVTKKYCHQYKTCKLSVRTVENTGKIGSKKVRMANKVIGYKPRLGFCFKSCDLSDIQLANCMPDK